MKTFNQEQQINPGSDNINVGNISNSSNIAIGTGASVTVEFYHKATTQEIAAKELHAALKQLEELPLDHVPAPSRCLPNGSRLLFNSNPHFVGREEELMALAQRLKEGKDTATIITGIGGIGKSQLAIAFVYCYAQYFSGGIHWINMANPNAIPTEIVLCGEQMYPDNSHFVDLDLNTQINKVSTQWKNNLPRLLIFDNCEDPTLLEKWLPKHGGSRVLITSRQAIWSSSRGFYVLPLNALTREQSMALLFKFRPDLISLTKTTEKEKAWAILDAIAQVLGDHPLALHMAGSYLETYRYDIKLIDYLDELQHPDLLKHQSLQGTGTDHSPTEHELNVERTFAMSTQRLNRKDPKDQIACRLLSRTAYFAPNDPIPRTLLLSTLHKENEDHIGNSSVFEKLFRKFYPAFTASIEVNPTVLNDILRRLVNLGLVTENQDGSLIIHQLISNFVHNLRLDTEAIVQVEESIAYQADVINETRIPGPLLTWQSHLRYITDRALSHRDIQAASLATQLGVHLKFVGTYAQARYYLKQALSIRQAVLGQQHLDTASSLNHFGTLLSEIGSYEEACPYHQQALAIYQTMLGHEHSDTADTLDNLGTLLFSIGKFEEAFPYCQQALGIRQKVLDPDHPDIANSLTHIGAFFFIKRDYKKIFPYYQRALNIRQTALGHEHRLTADSLNNLGILYYAIGENKKAHFYYKQGLEVCQTVLGQGHPDTTTPLCNLGIVLEDMGKYEEACSYYQRALVICEEMLGEMHPTTATVRGNLDGLLAKMTR